MRRGNASALPRYLFFATQLVLAFEFFIIMILVQRDQILSHRGD